MTFLFKSWTHSVTGFSDADLASAFLIGGRPQDIVSFLKKTCVMKNQEAECGLSVQHRIRVHDNGKCDIRANLYSVFCI